MDRDRVFGSVKDVGERGVHAGLHELGGFKKFILRGNVVDLAVGIVIGAAFSTVVNALVKDIITPLIPATSNTPLSTWAINLPYSSSKLLVGDFTNAIISFLIMALVIYFFVVRPVNLLQDRFTPHQEPAKPTNRECPFCLSTVPLKATRCAYCTAQLPAAEEPASETATRR
ncbi:MAG: large conductance mechanosensitive channel protein MscL [Chloroflexi bacterium]|nr:MAG: large conductance mechanosensitive channel protein MscL [Chloroflexota bacterium]